MTQERLQLAQYLQCLHGNRAPENGIINRDLAFPPHLTAATLEPPQLPDP